MAIHFTERWINLISYTFSIFFVNQFRDYELMDKLIRSYVLNEK